MEPAPARRREQQARIAPLAAELGVRLRWSERAETAGEGVVLANEVLDALPVRRVLLAGRGILALAVGLDERGAFRWEPRPAEAALAAEVEALLRRLPAPLPRPYVLELRPGLGDFLASALAGLERGAALFVDYGYPRHEFYLPERRMGTLVAHRGHRPVADPLAEPGRIGSRRLRRLHRARGGAGRARLDAERLPEPGRAAPRRGPARGARGAAPGLARLLRRGRRGQAAAAAGRDGRALPRAGGVPRAAGSLRRRSVAAAGSSGSTRRSPLPEGRAQRQR
ncbi:MAG: SAM-dependent methyltransferase [Xanthomonadales bacterium]|nr:SAM-dependent methyltransferase [Xanthomonadales bacterium]